jgi:hypothetical protein
VKTVKSPPLSLTADAPLRRRRSLEPVRVQLDAGQRRHVVVDRRHVDGLDDGAEVLDELVGRGPVVVRRRDHHRARARLRRVDAELHGLDRGERPGPGHDRETPVDRGEEGLGDQLALVEIQRGELPGAPPDDETVDPGRHQVLGQAVDRGRVDAGPVRHERCGSGGVDPGERGLGHGTPPW